MKPYQAGRKANEPLSFPSLSSLPICERVFSTKKLITPERNKLAPDIIEASECLKNWWDRGLIMQQGDGAVSAEDYESDL
jgi:hypothetical protein